jgi:hypothetical protein
MANFGAKARKVYFSTLHVSGQKPHGTTQKISSLPTLQLWVGPPDSKAYSHPLPQFFSS